MLLCNTDGLWTVKSHPVSMCVWTQKEKPSARLSCLCSVYPSHWVAMETALSKVARPFHFRSQNQHSVFYKEINTSYPASIIPRMRTPGVLQIPCPAPMSFPGLQRQNEESSCFTLNDCRLDSQITTHRSLWKLYQTRQDSSEMKHVIQPWIQTLSRIF